MGRIRSKQTSILWATDKGWQELTSGMTHTLHCTKDEDGITKTHKEILAWGCVLPAAATLVLLSLLRIVSLQHAAKFHGNGKYEYSLDLLNWVIKICFCVYCFPVRRWCHCKDGLLQWHEDLCHTGNYQTVALPGVFPARIYRCVSPCI